MTMGKEVNVAELMEQIKLDARNASYPDDVPGFEDLDESAVRRHTDYDPYALLEEVNTINREYNIIDFDPTAKKGIKYYLGKIIRRPIRSTLVHQTRFNAAVTRAINQFLKLDLEGQGRKLVLLEEDVQDNNLEIERLHYEIDLLEQRIRQLEEMLEHK